jgi:transposase
MALPLSQDLRTRIVRSVAEGSSIRQAAARFDVSPSSAIKLMQRLRRTGSTAPAKIGGYRRPLLAGHEALLRELTSTKPGITLVEIKGALAERGIEAGHISTISTTLRRLGLSHKKSR